MSFLTDLFGTSKSDIRPPDDFGERAMAATNYIISQAYARPVVIDQPTAIVASRPAIVPADYGAVADELGFAPPVLRGMRLRDVLNELGIPSYDYEKVDGYLRHLKAKANAEIWCWRPLRDRDALGNSWGAQQRYVGGPIGIETMWTDGSYAPGRGHSATYDRLVPKRSLQRALAIAKKMGDRVAFFVSDFANPKIEVSDPFIMVVMRDDPEVRVIFDVWNEPSFDVPPEA